jgi:isoquinoline 1-oxidoreductase beta subunit
MNPILNLSRREALLGLGAGAFVLGTGLPAFAADAEPHFGAMIAIAADGSVHFTCPSSEMGQGTHETLARLVGEELDCDWQKLQVLLPWADRAFINPGMGKQMTANSATTVGYYQALRKAGAAARAMLLQAAATRLGVPVADLTTQTGMVRHAASGRALSYGELASAAAALPVPAQVALKSSADFRLIGGKTPRKDLLAKVTGSAEFGIDVMRPAMLIGALALAPHPRAKVEATNIAQVKAMAGVAAVVPVDGGYAVLADKFWSAKKAAEALKLTLLSSPTAGLDSKAIDAELTRALAEVPPLPFPDFDFSTMRPRQGGQDKSSVLAALAAVPRRIEATYDVPYLAHAAMEPLNCSAHFADGKLTICGPLQSPEGVREAAAQAFGLPMEQVRVEVTFLGGGFGRKWGVDFPLPAAQAAMAVPGRWVKLIWTRENDLAMDQFRPAYRVKSVAGIAADGALLAMHSRIAGQSINTYHHRKGPPGMADPTAAGLLIYGCYDFPAKLMEYHEANLAVPVGFWRSVTMSQNSFFAESFIDEVARASGRDPYAYRRAMLGGEPRIARALDKAAQMIGWGSPKPKGGGRGIALTYNEGHVCAQAVQVRLTKKKLVIERIVAAFDCGVMVDPAGVEAQISGGIIFGLQAALWGEVPFADGRPTVANFNDMRLPTLADTPPITVALIPSGEKPGNAGEAGTPPIAPALANAIADAGGPRIRRLPIAKTLELA